MQPIDVTPVFQNWEQFFFGAIIVALVLWALLMAWYELR